MRPVPRLLLLLLAFSSTILAAEFPLAEPGIVPASATTYKRSSPIVAAGDEGFLVAWRELTFGIYPGGLYVRAYDRLGRPRQPLPTVVDRSARDPQVVWTGSEYLLVYARIISRFGSPGPVPLVLAVRIRADGTIVEGSEVPLMQDSGFGYAHALAWTGKAAVAIASTNANRQMLFLDARGRIESTSLITDLPSALIATGDGSFVLLRPEEGDAGAMNGTIVAAVENTSIGVLVTFMTRGHNVQSGFLLAPEGRDVRSIAWDGTAWITAYIQDGRVCTARFTSKDDVARQCNAETIARDPYVAAFGGRSLAAWSRNTDQIVTDYGIASVMVASQFMPVATVDANGLLAAWLEGEFTIRIGGMTANREPRPLHSIERPSAISYLRLASAGSHSLLVWNESGEVRAMRVDADGNPVPPLITHGGGAAPALASNGRQWLVAWEHEGAIESALVSRELVVTGHERRSDAGVDRHSPMAAATPDGFLIVWQESERLPDGLHERIVAQPLGGSAVHLVDRIDAVRKHESNGLACRGTSCLVTWPETGPGIAQQVGMIVGADGRPQSELRVLAQYFDGPSFVLAMPDGLYHVYNGPFLTYVAADGTPLTAMRWTMADLDLGGAVFFRDHAALVFARTGRVYVRDGSRERAVRH